MKLVVAIVGHGSRSEAFESAAAVYRARLEAYAAVEAVAFRDETALFEFANRQSGRTAASVVLLDGRGQEFSSEGFAQWLATRQDSGIQTLIFAIGPPDGWSDAARQRAEMLLSLSRMTLPHGLCRVILAEQLYRAFTILVGHPYHRKH